MAGQSVSILVVWEGEGSVTGEGDSGVLVHEQRHPADIVAALASKDGAEKGQGRGAEEGGVVARRDGAVRRRKDKPFQFDPN